MPAKKRRYMLVIPRPLYDAVKRTAQRNAAKGKRDRATVSSLIASVLESRFDSPRSTRLPFGKPGQDGSVNASVFLEPRIYEEAVAESERQYRGRIEAEPDGRSQRTLPLTRVVAGMLTKMMEKK